MNDLVKNREKFAKKFKNPLKIHLCEKTCEKLEKPRKKYPFGALSVNGPVKKIAKNSQI